MKFLSNTMLAALLGLSQHANAQAIGGNASLSVSSVSANVILPSTNTAQFPSVILAPAPSSSQEIFYNFGTAAVAATTSSPALPSGGICINIGPATYVAGITATGTATLRVTQVSGCVPFSGSSGASSPATTMISGYDSGPIAVPSTPANSSHAAGTSIGGLFAVPLARISGGSGILTSLGWKSTGGSTGQLVFRMWTKNPVNTICNDNAAFSGSDTDDAFRVPGFPLALTPAAPAVTTGDTATYVDQLSLTADYKNVDTAPSLNVYVCAVTVATDTADENKLVRLTLSGPQN